MEVQYKVPHLKGVTRSHLGVLLLRNACLIFLPSMRSPWLRAEKEGEQDYP